MTITIVVAVDNNGGIGKDGGLPWHVPAELAHFHRTVADMTTVCGVNTYQTLPKALRERTRIWSSRPWEVWNGERWVYRHTFDTDFVLSLSQSENVAIIGGAKTYAEFLPYAEKIIMSRIFHTFDADTFFPRYNRDEWKAVDQKEFEKSGGCEWAWIEFVRKVQP